MAIGLELPLTFINTLIMNNKRKIQECLFNIDTLCYEINAIIIGSIESRINQDNNLFSRLIKFNYIHFCSILEEVNQLNSVAKNDTYLKETLSLITPIIKGLNKNYSGLRTARNSFIAHLNRDKTGKFCPFYKKLMNKDLPHNLHDFKQIYKSMFYINCVLKTRYPGELEEIRTIEEKEEVKYIKWLKTEGENNNKANSFESIFQTVEQMLKDKNIELSTEDLPIKSFF